MAALDALDFFGDLGGPPAEKPGRQIDKEMLLHASKADKYHPDERALALASLANGANPFWQDAKKTSYSAFGWILHFGTVAEMKELVEGIRANASEGKYVDQKVEEEVNEENGDGQQQDPDQQQQLKQAQWEWEKDQPADAFMLAHINTPDEGSSNEETFLITIASGGTPFDVEKAAILIECGQIIDKPCKYGWTAFMKACYTCNTEMAIFLVNSGCDWTFARDASCLCLFLIRLFSFDPV